RALYPRRSRRDHQPRHGDGPCLGRRWVPSRRRLSQPGNLPVPRSGDRQREKAEVTEWTLGPRLRPLDLREPLRVDEARRLNECAGWGDRSETLAVRAGGLALSAEVGAPQARRREFRRGAARRDDSPSMI